MFTSKTRRGIFLLTTFFTTLFVPLQLRASEEINHFRKGLDWYRSRAEQAGDTTADPVPITRAIDHFQQALDGSASDTAPALYLLKSYFFKSTYVPMSSQRRRAHLVKGKKLGQRMTNKHPESASLKFWYAINLGRWAEEYGVLAAAREGIAGTMRELCKEVIRLDPQYEGGGGYWLLGRVHYKSPYIPLFLNWPSNERAIKNFEKALEIAPDEPLTHLYYAEVLLDEGRTKEGREHLGRILDLPTREAMKIEDRRTKHRARLLLNEHTS